MKEQNIEYIYQELLTVYQNLKAEVIVAEILSNSSMNFSDIDISNESVFSRSYRRDIIDTKFDVFSGKSDKIKLSLARNGIYDSLPEGVFHRPIDSKDKTSYNEIRKRYKKQEKDARNFFAPLENEFFTQQVKIEQNERLLINKFTNLKNDFLLKFWKLNDDIPKEYSIKLLQLLPYVHQISGNLELTALSLEKIINEKVEIQRKDKKISDHIKESFRSTRLGVDMTLSLEETAIYYPSVTITIGPVKRSKMKNYTKNGVTKKFISTFCDYFLPMEMDSELTILSSEEENTFTINKEDSPRIGLTTTI
ncbi:hypothetical protein ACFSTE_20760 [Aquimarina hainanensis]|uniref:Uncharacterized protein n=1 Tax=Aquimarina hainanensis TaxID=1578017 RepID=A0ABW5NEN5_9FLAO|nr:hypothetical protein [Aquimarina sp. TRL1]QKX07180.1 hypothetical protein HN014_20425 [Aquimarina sp. TRL1]